MRKEILKLDLLSAARIKPHRGQSNAVAIKHSLSPKPKYLLYFYLLTLTLAKINKLEILEDLKQKRNFDRFETYKRILVDLKLIREFW